MWLLAAVLAIGPAIGCDDDRPRHTSTRGELDEPMDGSVGSSDGGLIEALGGFDPSVVLSDPQDIGTSLCPGVRLYRIDRRHAGAPPSAPPLSPRFFGRSEYGQVMSFREVLLCELRIMHWVMKFRDEGAFLILWRGPAIFEPDSDCDWREPFRTELVPGGRTLQFHEHCRHRVRPGPADRTVTVELTDDYQHLFER